MMTAAAVHTNLGLISLIPHPLCRSVIIGYLSTILNFATYLNGFLSLRRLQDEENTKVARMSCWLQGGTARTNRQDAILLQYMQDEEM
jgi:hypothetical protein